MFGKQEYKIPSNWIYRGEGNCNIVISLPKERKILRIRKVKKIRSILSWLLSWISDIISWYCGSFDEEIRDLKFYKQVIQPLIGRGFVCDAQQVVLSRKQIQVLERKMSNERPEHRKNKRLQYGRVAIFDDYAFLPDEYYPFLLSKDTFAIEIKPKQGWIPFSEKIAPKCTFCLNQYIKLGQHQVKSLSSYCPLDLFSGEKTKMLTALKSLIYTPQNNLKIFKNGHFVYGEGCDIEQFQGLVVELFKADKSEKYESLLQEFCLLLQKCLLTNFHVYEKSEECSLKLFCEWNSIIQNSTQAKLPKGSILEKILSAQMLDVEGNPYYHKLLGSKKLGNYDYVGKLLENGIYKEGTCLKCTIMMLGSDENVCDEDLVLVPYLIATIAKDCSLMITFKKILDTSSDDIPLKNFIPTKYGDFIVNVGAFDLYPKPVSAILKHRKKFTKLMEIAHTSA